MCLVFSVLPSLSLSLSRSISLWLSWCVCVCVCVVNLCERAGSSELNRHSHIIMDCNKKKIARFASA